MQWIWKKDEDVGVFEFQKEFSYDGKAKAVLDIGSDFRYVAYINDTFVSNGQLADLPDWKFLNECDATHALKKGKNTLRVVAVHTGADYSVSHTMTPGLAFTLTAGGKVLAQSDETVLCRKSAFMAFDRMLSWQQGRGYRYDFTARAHAWEHAAIAPCDFRTFARPIQNLRISQPVPQQIVAQGVFRYRDVPDAPEDSPAYKMQNAWLASLPFAEMTGRGRCDDGLPEPIAFTAKGGDGIFIVADIRRETAGHLSVSLNVPEPCKAIVGWGEHLTDLRVRTYIDGRNFAEQVALRAGDNEWENYLARVGCRYLCLFVESPTVTLKRMTLRESTYPFNKPQKDFGDGLLNKIYETSRRTLELCAHEHYEDCPWREQALYGEDSRRQAKLGYGAFGEVAFPRESFRLMARSMWQDDLVELCAPAHSGITIPSYTLGWILGICENAEKEYDRAFVREMLPYCEKAMRNFERRTTQDGVTVFTQPRYWNFHDWTPGLDGGNFNRAEQLPPDGDGILTCMAYRSARELARWEAHEGFAEESAGFAAYAEKLKKALENYYDEEKGVYAAYIRDGKRDTWHQQMQAWVLLCGGAPEGRIARLVQELQTPSEGIERMPYSIIKYEAILRNGGSVSYCVDEIRNVYGGMLDEGSTSFWETELGERDFNNAGSLCHAWSAVACWVFDNYLPNKKG